MAKFLMPGDKFPNLTLTTVDSGEIVLPDDNAEGAQGSIDEGVTFPIGFGMDVDDAQKLGAWTGARQGMTILQPCEFVLNPAGEVMASLYATTQLGRINPEEILRFVQARK